MPNDPVMLPSYPIMSDDVFNFVKSAIEKRISNTILFNAQLSDEQLEELNNIFREGNKSDNSFFEPTEVILFVVGGNVEKFLKPHHNSIKKVIFINLYKNTSYVDAMKECLNFKPELAGVSERIQNIQKTIYGTEYTKATFAYLNNSTLDTSIINQLFLNSFSYNGIHLLLEVAAIAKYNIIDIEVNTAQMILGIQECNLYNSLTQVLQAAKLNIIRIDFPKNCLQLYNNKPEAGLVNHQITFSNAFTMSTVPLADGSPTINLTHNLPFIDSLGVETHLRTFEVLFLINDNFVPFVTAFLQSMSLLHSLVLSNKQIGSVTDTQTKLSLFVDSLINEPHNIKQLRFENFDQISTFEDQLARLITSPDSKIKTLRISKYSSSPQAVKALFNNMQSLPETQLQLKNLSVMFDESGDEVFSDLLIESAFSKQLILEKLAFLVIDFSDNLIKFTDEQLVYLLQHINQHQPQLKSLVVTINETDAQTAEAIIEEVHECKLFNLGIFVHQKAFNAEHDAVETQFAQAFTEHLYLLYFNNKPQDKATQLRPVVDYVKDKNYLYAIDQELNKSCAKQLPEIQYIIEREIAFYDFAEQHPDIISATRDCVGQVAE